jgi:hypothetical protein
VVTTASARRPIRDLLARATDDLRTLVAHPVEGVSAVERTEDGWHVEVDVVELERIPDTTSILASYELELDEDGAVLSYRRTRRFTRAATEES